MRQLLVKQNYITKEEFEAQQKILNEQAELASKNYFNMHDREGVYDNHKHLAVRGVLIQRMAQGSGKRQNKALMYINTDANSHQSA